MKASIKKSKSRRVSGSVDPNVIRPTHPTVGAPETPILWRVPAKATRKWTKAVKAVAVKANGAADRPEGTAPA